MHDCGEGVEWDEGRHTVTRPGLAVSLIDPVTLQQHLAMPMDMGTLERRLGLAWVPRPLLTPTKLHARAPVGANMQPTAICGCFAPDPNPSNFPTP